jgi:hypothetical protein
MRSWQHLTTRHYRIRWKGLNDWDTILLHYELLEIRDNPVLLEDLASTLDFYWSAFLVQLDVPRQAASLGVTRQLCEQPYHRSECLNIGTLKPYMHHPQLLER